MRGWHVAQSDSQNGQKDYPTLHREYPLSEECLICGLDAA